MNNSSKPTLSVIIPTRNSALHLGKMMESLKLQTYTNFEIIINDSPDTSDNTSNLIEHFRDQLNIIYIQENDSMAQARLIGAKHARSSIFLHLDSDMILEPDVIRDCIQGIFSGYDALVIPEISFGVSFWAQCKVLEKQIYQNVQELESVRCISKEKYYFVGGHDPEMVFSEDKDLDLRIRNAGSRIGRINNYIRHDEGNLSLLESSYKKLYYSHTANMFATKHPDAYRWQSNIFIRYWLFLKNINLWYKRPLLFFGLIILKTSEYLFAFIGLVKKRLCG
jgi:arabinofuranan 3-O-arabinosyltransferase